MPLTTPPKVTVSVDLTQPVVFGTSGSTDGKIGLASTSDSTTKWWLGASVASFNGHPDPAMFLGWNVRGVGDMPNPAAHGWHLALEADYWSTGSTHVCEGYFEYNNEARNVTRRPLQVVVDRASGDSVIYTAGKMQFKNSDQTQLSMVINDNQGAVLLYTYLHNTVAGAVFLKTVDSAGNGAYDVLAMKADGFYLGSPGIDIRPQGVIYTSRSIRVTNSGEGLVLKDRTTAQNYILYVNNGTLGVQAVA